MWWGLVRVRLLRCHLEGDMCALLFALCCFVFSLLSVSMSPRRELLCFAMLFYYDISSGELTSGGLNSLKTMSTNL